MGKVRKPRDCEAHKDVTVFIGEGKGHFEFKHNIAHYYYQFDLKQLKQLHKWLGRAIAYLEGKQYGKR